MLLCAEVTLARLWPQKRRPAQKQRLAQESCSESLERPPAPPLLPQCPRLCPPGEVSSLFRRDQMHSGRWPGHSGQQDAGPHKNARNHRSLCHRGQRPGTAASPGLPASTQDQPLARHLGHPASGQPPCPPHQHPQGPEVHLFHPQGP